MFAIHPTPRLPIMIDGTGNFSKAFLFTPYHVFFMLFANYTGEIQSESVNNVPGAIFEWTRSPWFRPVIGFPRTCGLPCGFLGLRMVCGGVTQ